MNSSSYDQLRWCERYKNTLSFQSVEAFAKKIRKLKRYQDEILNANAEQNQITVFYKEGWEYEHAHSNLTCDISNPIYIQEKVNLNMDNQMVEENMEQNNEKIFHELPFPRQDMERQKQYVQEHTVKNYYRICNYFIQRLKTQHENQTAFLIETRWIEHSTAMSQQKLKQNYHTNKEKKFFQNLICARKTYKNFFQTIGLAVEQMLENLTQVSKFNQLQYIKIIQVYQVLNQWIDEKLMIKKEIQDKNMQEWIQLMQEDDNKYIMRIHQFMANFIGLLQQMKDKKRSCLFNFQPQMWGKTILTYLIHPALLSLYALHHKQRIIWQNQYQHNQFNIDFNQPIKQKQDKKHKNRHQKKYPVFQQDTPDFQISRTAFINFDGYQSQFNIQFAKNMQNHLMYISFPLFDKDKSEQNIVFNNRFFKKIFFNYTRDLYDNNNSQQYDVLINNDYLKRSDQQDPNEQLSQKFDPERYYTCITNMYKDIKICEVTKNINIFPLNFQYLRQQLATLFYDETSEASKCTSYFIYYLFKQFLMDDIRKFNPTQIIISYSGRINIIDQHFIKLMQEFAIISYRKMMFFPNFTTKLIDHNTLQIYKNYDNFLPTSPTTIDQLCNIDLMKKMSQFLKISSGTYNLDVSYQPQSILPKYTLAKLNNYIRGVLNSLSNFQYPHLKGRISDLMLRIQSTILNDVVEQNIQQIRKQIPEYYKQLFNHIITIIKDHYNQFPPILQDLVSELRSEHQVFSRNQKLQLKNLFIQDITQRLQLQYISQKFSETAYVYFKTKRDKKQYEEIKQQIGQKESSDDMLNKNKSQANNLSGLYSLYLRYSKQKQKGYQKINLPIYASTQLLYRQNQIYKETKQGNNYANIMLMNHLQKNQFISLAGLVPLTFYQQGVKQKKIKIERGIQMYPIKFNGMPQLAFKKFVIRSGWNYAQTRKYFFLYWPLQFNILQAKLRYLKQQTYQPNILNQFYVCQIPKKQKEYRLTFNRVMIDQPNIVPRRNCSCLQLIDENKIIILGGFYSKQYNYLSLQSEITGVDLSNYSNDHQKCKITNEKGTLYQDLQQKKNKKEKTNSYIPARRQYQIFQLQQLCDLNEEQIQRQKRIKTFIVLGGFGQNFIRPYSLITYNYFIIKVDMQTKSINSIQKKIIYSKIINSNIRGFIKNNNFYSKLPMYQSQILTEKDISPECYIAHRSVFSFTRQQGQEQLKIGELKAKTKYLFAITIYNKIKKQFEKIAKKIGLYFDLQKNQSSQFFLSLSPQGNHFLTIKKNNEQRQSQIYLQKIQPKSKFQKVSLTHGSIVSIDIRHKYIYAIVKHDSYTQGKYVLTQCIKQSVDSQVLLKVVHEFQQNNLQQYHLITPRPNQILLLHGLTFKNVIMPDICVTIPKKQINKQNMNCILKQIPFPNSIQAQKYKSCVTLMVKTQSQQTKSVQVQSINLLIPAERKPKFYTIRKYRLKLNINSGFEFMWEQTAQFPVIFIDQQGKTNLHIQRVLETRQIQLHNKQKQMIQSPLYSNAANSMTQPNTNNIILKMKFKNDNSKSLTGICKININHDVNIKNQVIFVLKIQSTQGGRVWDLGSTIVSHTKSITNYQDM